MIAIVGHTAIDHLFRVPNLPGRHNSTYITEHTVYFGGGAANIAAGIAVLGERCRLISAVGSDFPGSGYDPLAEASRDRAGLSRGRGCPDSDGVCLYPMMPVTRRPSLTGGRRRRFARLHCPDFVHMATADPEFNVQVARKSRSFCLV